MAEREPRSHPAAHSRMSIDRRPRHAVDGREVVRIGAMAQPQCEGQTKQGQKTAVSWIHRHHCESSRSTRKHSPNPPGMGRAGLHEILSQERVRGPMGMDIGRQRIALTIALLKRLSPTATAHMVGALTFCRKAKVRITELMAAKF